jgi:hypothetical protein
MQGIGILILGLIVLAVVALFVKDVVIPGLPEFLKFICMMGGIVGLLMTLGSLVVFAAGSKAPETWYALEIGIGLLVVGIGGGTLLDKFFPS